jgi:TonB family protein
LVSVTLVLREKDLQEYSLRQEDLDNFRRMVSLYDMVTLPLRKEGAGQSRDGTEHYLAGYGGITFPEILPKSRVLPKYRDKARRAMVQGRVVLLCVVHEDGTVGEIHVEKSSVEGYGLEEAAIKAVKKWRYKPALMDGKPVDVWFTVVVDFFLHQ